jgi:hypothetical protein
MSECACERNYCLDCSVARAMEAGDEADAKRYGKGRHCRQCKEQTEMAAKRKKKASKRSGGAVKKLGKITFFYFSGDVGEFLDAMTAMLKKPGVAQGIAEAMAQAAPFVEAAAQQKDKSDDSN